ncbi:hypothetical protein [Glaciibacter psychrotolerans]|uniref:Uncharacterized protein n=1 Tax=Glaciibacter psychrotolerans TaxID=670054 RepID=A0A7Z0J729_9MICO|nr:hypothetical protein [Leifsonia psychrotolerans]NYJ21050.1 hypothetical protein [Leifsonia psychrotolerans]
MADVDKLWKIFDLCEMYLLQPDYFGAPVYRVNEQLVTPVFSSDALLTRFIEESALGPDRDTDGFDWMRLTGAKIFGLPVRARFLVIDPGSPHSATVDLASREDPPPLAGGAPPIAINLQIDEDGRTIGGPPQAFERV